MKILIVDPGCSGVDGSILLASLIDLTGEPRALDPLAGAIRDLGICREFRYGAERVGAGEEVAATLLSITAREEGAMAGDDFQEACMAVADDVGLSPGARDRVSSVLGDLTAVSFRPAETIFSVVGTMFLLDRAEFFEGTIVAMPPALGATITRTDCGDIPGPAPATLAVLTRHRFPFASVPAEADLTTPVGAALLAAITERSISLYPAMTPARVGYGIRPSGEPTGLLRVMEGESLPPGEDRVVMLETNLDDTSGEVIGYTIERLFAEGAADVFVTPAFGKKNRPVSVVSVMAAAADENRLIRILMEETGTLGVRVREFRKVVADRRKETVPVSVGGREYPIRVKTASANGRPVAEKPEYDDLAAIARNRGIPLRLVGDEVRLCLSERRRERTAREGGAGGGCPPDLPSAANTARDG